MKNFFFWIPLFLLTVGLTSCSSDDDANGVDALVGSWKISDVKVNETSMYEFLIQLPEGCFLYSQVHFNNDHTLKLKPYEFVNNGCQATSEQNGTWSKSGNQYAFTMDGEESDPVVLNFQNNNQFSYSEEIDGVHYELYFTRM